MYFFSFPGSLIKFLICGHDLTKMSERVVDHGHELKQGNEFKLKERKFVVMINIFLYAQFNAE